MRRVIELQPVNTRQYVRVVAWTFPMYVEGTFCTGIGCPRFPCLRVVNCEFANHPSIFWPQQSTNSQIATSDVLCPRCATQICGFSDINKNKHSPRCAAAAATNLAAAPKKCHPQPCPRYHAPPSSGDEFGHAAAAISMVSVSEN
jgi:hypothetical protein